jgi:hydroxymethylbilane synthase
VTAERSLLEALEAGCSAPIGAYAAVSPAGGAGGVVPPGQHPQLRMRAAVLSPDGSRVLRAHGGAPWADAWQLGRDLAAELLRSGASDLISVPEGPTNSGNDVQ